MTKMTSSLLVASLLAFGLTAAPAQALFTRTFVSAANGNDANDCDRLTPCRTFFGAHAKTNAGGEIVVLDPGGYGGLTITKSISIVNEGVGEASLFVVGGQAGITISAGVNDAIRLRGIAIYGIGANSGNGIVFNTGGSLTIENCAIRNLTGGFPLGNGIKFLPNGSSSLAVSNTVVANNAFNGIIVAPTGSGNVRAVFSRVEAYNNGGNGISVSGLGGTGTINATVADSVAANNSADGFVAGSAAGQATTRLMVIRSVVANNANGLFVGTATTAILLVGQSTVTGNATSWTVGGTGVLRSYGDNNINGNGDAPEPIPTLIGKK